MLNFVGGDADNLDFSSYPYQRLRAAVYGVSEAAVRVAANEWADLKRRVNERVGTLHVTISQLASVWDSPAGREAMSAFRDQRDWMVELARVAAVNEAHLADVQTVRIEAVNAMRILDAQPGGPVAPASWPRPVPVPGPKPTSGPATWVDPALQDWRQPLAAVIANRLYGQLAIAAASMAVPPTAPREISGIVGSPPHNAGQLAPGLPGQAVPGRSAAPRSRDGEAAQTMAGVPPAAGRAVSGLGQTADSSPSGPIPGVPAAARRRGVTVPGRTVGSGQILGRSPYAQPGAAYPGAAPPAAAQPPGRVLGGSPVTIPDAPIPGGGPGPSGPTGEPYPSTRNRRRYERGEPDTFVDKRFRNPAGGGIQAPGEPVRFDPLPGTLGNQKHKVAPDAPGSWRTDPSPIPEGFPEKLETFTRHDGMTFEVRRRGGL